MKRLLLVASLVVALPAAGFAQTPAPRQTTQGFSVVLLLGDSQAGPAPEGLSEAARKALADMKDFLPYKSYRVLDNQWITAGEGSQVTSRLGGMNGQELELQMRATARPNGLAVTFRLGDGRKPPPDVLVAAQQLAQASERLDAAERNLAASERQGDDKQRMSAKTVSVLARVQYEEAKRAADLVNAGSSLTPFIDTSFNMAIGETVVVGTSRVQGDKALVVLLTAVSRNVAPPTSFGPVGAVFLTGEVNNPGKYVLDDGMTVLQLVAKGGGSREPSTITVAHAAVDGVKPPPIDALLITTLLPGDTVNVALKRVVYVSGFVKNPGEQPFLPGMKVKDLIARAGGLANGGNERMLTVSRKVDGKVTTNRVELETPLQRGDELRVPRL